MLQRTFQHLKGAGPITEAELWRMGVKDWQALLDAGQRNAALARWHGGIRQSQRRLETRDAAFFQSTLPPSERWRLYSDFAHETAFLDIETTGLSREHAFVTLAGLLDVHGFKAYIRGDNLDELPEALGRYRLIVTFNGAAFDLPFLESEFSSTLPCSRRQGLFAHAAHLDLMHVLRRVGLRGGLKKIERATGLGRGSDLSQLDGYDAVRLWRLADEGEPLALETLVRYNAEDVASLPRLANFAVNELSYGTPLAGSLPPTVPEIDAESLPYDPGLVSFLSRRRRSYV